MTSRIVCQNLALPTWDIQCHHLKELFTRISKPKKVLKDVYPIKRYDVLKCGFLLFLVTKCRKIHISNLDIFWVDRDISDFLSVLKYLWQVVSNGNTRHPMPAKPNSGTQPVTPSPRQKCKNLKNKKHRILENDEPLPGAQPQNNWIKTQNVTDNQCFLGLACTACCL